MNTPLMVTAIICVTVLTMDIVSEISGIIKMRMRMNHKERLEKEEK